MSPLLLCAPWLTSAVAHAEPEAVLAEAIERYRAGLTLPDAPETYHLRYQLLALGQVDARASMGSLISADQRPFHGIGVEVRVGTPAYDNTGFGGWQNGFARSSLPSELTDGALRTELWRVTDGAYKEAVEQFARKQSQFEAPADWPGDYTLTGPVTADLGAAKGEAAPDRLVALAKAMSARLRTPEARLGEVLVGHEAGAMWIVDSEGTRVQVPVEETSIRAIFQVRADDGQLLTDQRLFTVRSVDSLPDDNELFAAVDRLRDGLLAAAKAPAWSEEYVGPVVFRDGAAADLFRYLLVPQLEGTPSEIPFDSFFGELGASTDPVRVGRRVLPSGWRVKDDPTADPSHPASFAYDQEGTKAVPIELVEDGIVRTLAMSRVPRRGLTATNGHGRGMIGERISGRATNLEVTPDRSLSEVKLAKAAAKAARAYGRDWWVEVSRLQEPSAMGHETSLWFDAAETPLPPPVAVTKRYADGRVELLRGARLAGVQRWLLRDIVAAGSTASVDLLSPLVPGEFGGMRPTEGLVTRLRAPTVLVGEVEIVPETSDPMDVPVVPPPPEP